MVLEPNLSVPAEMEIVPEGAIFTQPGGYKAMKVADKRPK